MSELKPCPFCGGEAVRWMSGVGCKRCRMFCNADLPDLNWNRRAPSLTPAQQRFTFEDIDELFRLLALADHAWEDSDYESKGRLNEKFRALIAEKGEADAGGAE